VAAAIPTAHVFTVRKQGDNAYSARDVASVDAGSR
jgi:hypothetical protein